MIYYNMQTNHNFHEKRDEKEAQTKVMQTLLMAIAWKLYLDSQHLIKKYSTVKKKDKPQMNCNKTFGHLSHSVHEFLPQVPYWFCKS